MKIMLCGASDTSSIYQAFDEVVRDFAATPMTFLNSSHSYTNSLASSFEGNSRQSVIDADICVFVIKKNYGKITWNVEYNQALNEGKPFLILCEQETYNDYLTLKRMNLPFPEDNEELFTTIDRIENVRELTISKFIETDFENRLREQLGKIIDDAIKVLTEKRRRENLWQLMGNHRFALSLEDIHFIVEIAVDEYEDKKRRKDAIKRLSKEHCLDKETMLALISSEEQGVSRIAVENMNLLLSERENENKEEFLADCVKIINDSDDIGLKRRFINKVLGYDLREGLCALRNFDLSEIGSKRRLSIELIKHKEEIIAESLQETAIVFAEECCKKGSDGGWKEDCQILINELKESMNVERASIIFRD